jgi:alpha-tubulin suppressor-like RCC1 family protein
MPRVRDGARVGISVLLSAYAAALACGGDPSGPADDNDHPDQTDDRVVTSVTVSPDTALLTALGATQPFTAEIRDQNDEIMTNKNPHWSASGTAVTINLSGTATAIVVGTATITASVDGVEDSASVTVIQVPASLGVSSQPGDTPTDVPLTPLAASLLDAGGNLIPHAPDTVTVALNGPGNLSGTLAVALVDGTATFSDLTIDSSSAGVTLVFTAAPSGISETTEEFDVLLRFSSVSVGTWTACGVTTKHVGYCWGEGDLGVRGCGNTEDAPAPQQIAGAIAFAQIDVGTYHACGLDVSGIAHCWGANNGGQLGNGTYDDSWTPVAVNGDRAYRNISVDGQVTCAVTPADEVFCWGGGMQLGAGPTVQFANEPVPVFGDIPFATVDLGSDHTCGVATTAVAYCWGSGADGRLGNGIVAPSDVPVPVSGDYTFATVSAGMFHTCGLLTTGAAMCWGNNDRGAVGDGTTDQRNTPVPVAGGHVFTAVTAGDDFTCGMTSGSGTYCWGRDLEELGELWSFSTTPVAIPAADHLVQLAIGQYACGLDDVGAAWCWGSGNFEGQIGDGTWNPAPAPTRVAPPR